MAFVLGPVAGGAGVQKIVVRGPAEGSWYKGTRVQVAGDTSVTPSSGIRRLGGQTAPLSSRPIIVFTFS